MITFYTRGKCDSCNREVRFEISGDGVLKCPNCGKTVNVCKKCHGTGWWQHTERDEGGKLIFHISIPCPDCTTKNKEGDEQ